MRFIKALGALKKPASKKTKTNIELDESSSSDASSLAETRKPKQMDSDDDLSDSSIDLLAHVKKAAAEKTSANEGTDPKVSARASGLLAGDSCKEEKKAADDEADHSSTINNKQNWKENNVPVARGRRGPKNNNNNETKEEQVTAPARRVRTRHPLSLTHITTSMVVASFIMHLSHVVIYFLLRLR